MQLPRGQVVAVIKSKLAHASIGSTFWILSTDYDVIYQVAESAYGRNLNQLIIKERPVKSQELCKINANRLLSTGQYGLEHRHEIRKLIKRRR